MKKLIISPSPHIHGAQTTRNLMRDVLIALVPAFAVTVVLYGVQTIVVTGVAVASCVLFEYLIQRFMLRGSSTVGDLSAIVTGVLLAFNLPIGIPLWMVALGSLVAIGVGKMTFGGLGRNLFNPALVGRVFLLVSFPVAMTTFGSPEGVDAFTGSTPLTFVREALKSGKTVSEIMPQISFEQMLFGLKSGSFGEIATLALLAGFVYLLARRVITWHIPVVVLGSMAVVSGVLWFVDPQHYMSPAFHLLTGGAVLGAVFMATDYVSSPMNTRSMVVYAVGIGVITMLIRTWGSYPEGISFAILIMNAVVPLLNKYVKPRSFGIANSKK